MTIKSSKIQVGFTKPERIINIVQSITGIKPVRQVRILYPVWDVLAMGNQPDVEEYELLEQFIEAGIHHGKLVSTLQLHQFFGLEQSIVNKMLSFLHTIGHIAERGGVLQLTPLGLQSLTDGVSYRNMETHRTLYFEAFGLQPLPRDYYDLRFLSWLEAEELRDPTIYHLHSERGWDHHAVAALSRRLDRAAYNLPDDVVLNEIGSANIVYFPMSIVETRQHNPMRNRMEKRYIAISQISQMHDQFFESIVNKEVELQEFLEDDFEKRNTRAETDLERWLNEQPFVRGTKLVPQQDGPWRVQIAAEIFQQGSSKLSIRDIGNYKLIDGSHFLQIWCLDQSIRHTSALEQTRDFIERKKQRQQSISQSEIKTFLRKICQRLEIEPVDKETFRQYLISRNNDDLFDDSEE